jgi:hypothetical protein
MPTKCLKVLLLALATGVFLAAPAQAGELVIGNGSTLTLNGSTLILNCDDVTVQSGGTLDLQAGLLAKCGDLLVETGGIVIYGDGWVQHCGAMVPILDLLLSEPEPGGWL